MGFSPDEMRKNSHFSTCRENLDTKQLVSFFCSPKCSQMCGDVYLLGTEHCKWHINVTKELCGQGTNGGNSWIPGIFFARSHRYRTS